jgi:hypothetical protein
MSYCPTVCTYIVITNLGHVISTNIVFMHTLYMCRLMPEQHYLHFLGMLKELLKVYLVKINSHDNSICCML